jgi:hypothetical protein
MADDERNPTVCGILVEFASVTSLQGIPFIRSSRKTWTRGAWVLVFVGAVCMWLLHTYMVCVQYYAYATTTRVHVSHATLPFPSVTVCNMNPLRRSMVEDVGPELLSRLLNTMTPRTRHYHRHYMYHHSDGAYDSDTVPLLTRGQPIQDAAFYAATNTSASKLGTVHEDEVESTGKPRTEQQPRKSQAAKRNNETEPEKKNAETHVFENDSYDGDAYLSENITDFERDPSPTAGVRRGMAEAMPARAMPAQAQSNTMPNTEKQIEGGNATARRLLRMQILEKLGAEEPDALVTQRRKRKRTEVWRSEHVGAMQQHRDKAVLDVMGALKSFHQVHGRISLPQKTTKNGKLLGKGLPTLELVQGEAVKEIVLGLDKSLRSDLGHQKEVLILECSFNGMTCSAINFSHFLTPDYGNCYTFNSGMPDANGGGGGLYSARAGVRHGLHLKLFTEHNEHIAGLRAGKGVRLAIHPPGTMPFVAENGISLATGLALYAGLRLVNVTRLGSPYPPCVAGMLEGYDSAYTLEACTHTCLDRTIARNCQCRRPGYEQYYTITQRHNLSLCQTQAQIDCKLGVVDEYNAGERECECQVACESINYDILLSSNDWPDETQWYELVDSVCEMDDISCDFLLANEREKATIMRRNFLSVNIYYQDLNYETIEENPAYEDAQFYSDLGGAVGLWIGATMFTIVELLSVCLRIVTLPLRRRLCPRPAPHGGVEVVTGTQHGPAPGTSKTI